MLRFIDILIFIIIYYINLPWVGKLKCDADFKGNEVVYKRNRNKLLRYMVGNKSIYCYIKCL